MKNAIPPEYPRKIVSGDTFSWSIANSSYPSTDYTLKISVQSLEAGVDPTVFDGVIEGDGFLVMMPSEVTETIKPGTYSISEVYTRVSDSARFTRLTWVLRVTPNPLGTPETSWARTTLGVTETAIKNLATKAMTRVSVDGQVYEFQDLNKLIALRDRLRFEVASEMNAAGIPTTAGGRRLKHALFNDEKSTARSD